MIMYAQKPIVKVVCILFCIHTTMVLSSVLLFVWVLVCLHDPHHTHVQVWALGEYSHTGYDTRCTTALLSQYFEVTSPQMCVH